MKKLITCLLICTTAITSNAQTFKKFERLTIQQIDTLRIPKSSAATYLAMTNYAVKLLNDTSDKKQSTKGDILLALLADHLGKEITLKHLSQRDDTVKILYKIYAAHQYYLPPLTPSDFIKLAHYACGGDYSYIYSRFKVKSYFLPAVISIVLFFIFSVVHLFGVIKWKYKKGYNIFFLCFISLIIISALVFAKTCDKYVKEDSLYGIDF